MALAMSAFTYLGPQSTDFITTAGTQAALLVSDSDSTKHVPQRSVYLWQTKWRRNKTLRFQESIKMTKLPHTAEETKDKKIKKHVWREEINERSKGDVAHGFKMIFIKYCAGLHLVFSLFLYISSGRERQRPMMRQCIKGLDRLFPQLLLQVDECKKESLTVSPVRLGSAIRVRGCGWQVGWGLGAGCFAYLSLSSQGIEGVWPAAECASSRSLRSYWAEAAEGCWSPPAGATQWGVLAEKTCSSAQMHRVCAKTCLFKHTQLKALSHWQNQDIYVHLNLKHMTLRIRFFKILVVFSPLPSIYKTPTTKHRNVSSLNFREPDISLQFIVCFEVT